MLCSVQVSWGFAAGMDLLLAGCVLDHTQYPVVILWGEPSALLFFGCIGLGLSGTLPAAVRRFRTLGGASYAPYLVHALLIPPLMVLVMPAEGRFRPWPLNRLEDNGYLAAC